MGNDGKTPVDLLNPNKADEIEYGIESVQTQSSVSVTLSYTFTAMHSYSLILKAEGDLHANVLLSLDSDIQVIPDGISQRVYAVSDNKLETRYFAYLPPSPKFHFIINTRAYTDATPHKIYIKKVNSADLASLMSNNRILAPRQGQSIPAKNWWEKIVEGKQFDFEISTSDEKNEIFESVPIEMSEGEDTLVIIAQIAKGS